MVGSLPDDPAASELNALSKSMAASAEKMAVEAAAAAVHGNSKLSTRTAYLYRLETKSGEYLKTGISQNPARRYTKTQMAGRNLVILDQGTRIDMLAKERGIVEVAAGPLNREPWASWRREYF